MFTLIYMWIYVQLFYQHPAMEHLNVFGALSNFQIILTMAVNQVVFDTLEKIRICSLRK